MVKIVFCVRRRAGMSPEEFSRYWLEVHGPKVRKHAATLGIRRYVQTHTQHGPANDSVRRGREGVEPFDGVAEVWYDSLEAVAAAGNSEDGREAGRELLHDERQFIDIERSTLWLSMEHEIVALDAAS